ncbi:secretin N-terminal domain-containing protein [Halarsenatibacter silvermanii]|nr:secretin N-terminal domain-containing protein [Halarsenatibacter silvermanii]
MMILLLMFSIGGGLESLQAVELDDQKIDMEYVDTPVREVLRSLARLSGENIVFDETVEGEITLELEGVDLRTAMDKILSVKDLDYYIEDEIMVVASPERIDELYREIERRLYTLEHTGTQEASELIGEMLPQVDVDMLPDQKRLILSGLPENLQEAEELLQEIDQPIPHESQVFSLENISPEEAAAEIESLFPDIFVSARQAYGDIIVRGHTDELNEAAKLIEDIDIPRDKIRETYLPADLDPEDLQRRLMEIYSEEELNVQISEGIITLEGRPAAVEEAIGVMSELEEVEEELVETSVRLNYIDVEEMQEIITGMEEGISLQASTERDTLFLQGGESRVRRAEDAVRELDHPRRQVLLEVNVEEISLDVLEEKGINVDELREDVSAIGLDYDDDYLISGFDVDMPEVYDLFEKEDATETLATPSLLTLDGEEAELEIVEEVPYREETDVDNGTDVSWEYEEVGVTLNFNPSVTEEDTINLHMEPEVSTIVDREFEGAPPETRARRFENTVKLHDGQTFAVGGLIQEEERHDMRQIPYLGDLPLLGRLFSYEELQEDQTEIFIFIEAHIVDIMEDDLDMEEIDHEVFEDRGEDFEVHSDPYGGMKDEQTQEDLIEPEAELDDPETGEILPEEDKDESLTDRMDEVIDDFMSRYENDENNYDNDVDNGKDENQSMDGEVDFKTTEEMPEPEHLQADELESRYLIQTGAFSEKRGAEIQAGNLLKRGYSAFLYSSEPYTVQVKGGQNREEAEELVQELEKLVDEVLLHRPEIQE